MDIQKINKEAGVVLAGLNKDLTLDEKSAVLLAAKTLIESIQGVELTMEIRTGMLDNIIKRPAPSIIRKH